ncbi:MAG TPA: hypothetical protein VEH62_11215 [Gemmatimonadales bacterium]|nr:hypothetical protein [Gemmatimonadales bacterium]
MTGLLRIIAGTAGVVAILGGVRRVTTGVKEPKRTGVVACDSDDAKATLKLAFNQSQYALVNRLTFEDVTDIRQTGYGADSSRGCHGTLRLSDQTVHSVNYQLVLKSGGRGQLRFSMQ